jgi:hypothetical protein
MIAVTKGVNGKGSVRAVTRAAKTALSIKPDLAAARSALAYTLLYADWDMPARRRS